MQCPNCESNIPVNSPFCPECGVRLTSNPVPTLKVLQDRYELTKKLGQGGMGAVYLASDRRLSTVRWAVKEMTDSAITSPLDRQHASEAFKQEAELLARLAHPNLPRVTDHFEQDGKNYLVMEFVPGESLQAYTERVGLPLPLPTIMDLTRQLCDVLGYLHAQVPPVVFRDLKPSNVMITPEEIVKLVDFGIARLFKPGQQRDTQAYGTVGYSSPEQYGRGQTDARSDIYSLGVLLHHLLTGHDPATTPFRLPLANQLNPTVSPQIAAALVQATETEPDKRFDTIVAFRQAFFASQQVQHAQVLPTEIALPRPAPASVPPISSPIAPGIPVATAQANTTALANTSRIMGILSFMMMAVATAVILVDQMAGISDDALSGLGVLLALVPLVIGPIAILLGLIAIFSKQIQTTKRGRRHVVIGMVLGLATLLLCCPIGVLISDDSNRDETSRALYVVDVARPSWGVL